MAFLVALLISFRFDVLPIFAPRAQISGAMDAFQSLLQII
jgi:hypothetical protein